MSEIKNLGYIWMGLNTFKCNYLTPLHFKGLKIYISQLLTACNMLLLPHWLYIAKRTCPRTRDQIIILQL